ncbi:hypothetical protein [Kamptonema formosum]|uniref:hypothetical protein n=1 Tax=Kamptonema formosum TaxID=331992 RepID=UPI0012DF2771|nr:hypothetical protein [Oscillatoria sp. PCC 10802]
MKLPNQSLPVSRRYLIQPDLVLVSVKDSKGRLSRREYQYVHGSNPNPNAPMKFSEPADCGCPIFSGVSMAMCFAACGIF